MSWTFVPVLVVLFDESQPAAAGPELDTDLLSFLDGEFQWRDSRVLKRFAGRRQGQRDCARHMFAILNAKLCLPVEIAHLRGDFYR